MNLQPPTLWLSLRMTKKFRPKNGHKETVSNASTMVCAKIRPKQRASERKCL